MSFAPPVGLPPVLAAGLTVNSQKSPHPAFASAARCKMSIRRNGLRKISKDRTLRSAPLTSASERKTGRRRAALTSAQNDLSARARDRAGVCEAQAGTNHAQKDFGCSEDQERESSESPMLNAFCRVAPSDLFSFFAILPAGVFLRAIVFRSRTSVAVQARRFFAFLAIIPPVQESWVVSLYRGGSKHNR